MRIPATVVAASALMLAFLSAARVAGQVAAPADEADGFVDLFNGRDLDGWHVVNGAPSDRPYENFVLEVEWRHLVPKGNAGIFVWSDPITAKGQPYTRGIEVQVLDGIEGSWYTSDGDIFPIHGATMTPENHRGGSRAFPTEKRMKPSPEWNHYRIECRDGSVSLAVNGKVVTKGHACSPRKGYICLESEGSPVDFRNLRLKELPPSADPPGPTETARLDEGFISLYTGVDFAGWKHGPEHEGHFTANDWRIDFDGGGADLWTERSFGDFSLICDWRWTGEASPTMRPVVLADGANAIGPDGTPVLREVPDAGDSGIYLRGSSKSQVNIWCWPIGSGEVYGYRTDASMPATVRAGVTPRVNADAPIGEWNRFEITMIGEYLSVDLNGRSVLRNAHLPGVAPEGPIALQHHGGALQFANIYIRELP
jgi:hypothetical protein